MSLKPRRVLIEGHLYSDVGLPERLAADGSMRQSGNTAWQSSRKSQATLVENGRQALEKLRGESFDLVLLDVQMPEMDGYQVLEQLKADAHLRDIPVIMISAMEELEGVVTCIELGAQDYLPKPFNPVLLRARLTACLARKRLRDQEVDYLQQVGRVKAAAAGAAAFVTKSGAIEVLVATIRQAGEHRKTETGSL
jgi:CheY-like chemotaxis protein